MIADKMLWFFGFFTIQEIAFLYSKKCFARMRTAAYKGDVASDRRRGENVPRHIFFKHEKVRRAGSIIFDRRHPLWYT